MNKKILIVIQVRMDSKRLPGKALVEVLGEPIILLLYKRLKQAKYSDDVVIATSTNTKDNAIVELAKRNDIKFYVGSEDDVVDRLYQTAKKFDASAIVRITGDCPLVDPIVIDRIIKFHLENPRYGYVSNIHPPTFPDGLDIELITFDTLEKVWKATRDDPFSSEWISPYISKHSKEFDRANIENSEDLSDLRWTLDHQEDLILIKKIFGHFNRLNFSMNEIHEFIDKNPELQEINAKYKRNAGYDEVLFEKNYSKIKDFTLLDKKRLKSLFDLLLKIKSVDGEIADCGVYTGGSSFFLALLAKELNIKKKVHMFDSFEGLPQPDREVDKYYNKGGYQSNYEEVTSTMKTLDLDGICRIHKGWFEQTFADVEREKFSFVHIDCDLYSSAKTCIDFFYPRLIKNGVMIFDDYNDGSDGVKKVVTELIEKTGEELHIGPMPQAYIIKKG